MKSLFISLLMVVSIVTIGCEVDSTNPKTVTPPVTPPVENPDAGQFKIVFQGLDTEYTDGRYAMATRDSIVFFADEMNLTFNVGTTEFVYDGVLDSDNAGHWLNTISMNDEKIHIAIGNNGVLWDMSTYTLTGCSLFNPLDVQIENIVDGEQIVVTYDFTEETVTVERYGEYL